MHLEAVSNGLGAPSMLMLHLACIGKLPATVSITADTGAENDRVMQDGTRITAADFFYRHVDTMCARYGIEAYFVRAVDKDKRKRLSLFEHVKAVAERCTTEGVSANNLHIPMFGSEGGKLSQSCTDNWKIGAVNQQVRRLGAKTMRNAQGLHVEEAWRRAKGVRLGVVNGFDTYQTIARKPKGKEAVVRKWLTHYYPLVDMGLSRAAIRAECDRLGLPYLVSSECDFCPYKDATRWERTSPEVIDEIAAIEAKFGGQYFFTNRLIPLKDAIAQMKRIEADKRTQGSLFDDADFGCNDVCGM